jgi:hypothetical protein
MVIGRIEGRVDMKLHRGVFALVQAEAKSVGRPGQFMDDAVHEGFGVAEEH